MKYVLFNPLSNNRKGKEKADEVVASLGEAEIINVLEKNNDDIYNGLQEGDSVYLVGGDGTLNKFVNYIADKELKNDVYYIPAGSGNDFYNDTKDYAENGMVKLNDLIKDLPTAYVKGESYKFINGIGFGIDGYCCEEGDKIRAEKPGEKVDYTAIAIKGLLFKFKPLNATVTVDGVTNTYKKVWLAPTMKGRFYGGGMMIAPDQDRKNPEKTVTCVVATGGKLPIFMAFPSIFKGEHTSKKKLIKIVEGKEVTVKFDRPCALQVDGETILGVTEYTVKI